jgi:hypothetical protein
LPLQLLDPRLRPLERLLRPGRPGRRSKTRSAFGWPQLQGWLTSDVMSYTTIAAAAPR